MFKSDRVDPGASPRPDEREASDAAPGDERPVDVGPATDADADDVEAPPSAPAAAEVDYRDRWLRAEAEIQNVRRRAQRDLDEQTRAVEERMLLEVIDVLDDLDRALASAEKAGDTGSWIQGVRLVSDRLLSSLARSGATPIEPIGAPFDPHLHEAMLEVEAPEGMSAGDVVHVIRRGWKRSGRTLRPARVAVARAPAERA